MKRIFITIFVLLSFSANSVMGMGMVCDQTKSDHSMHMSMPVDGDMDHDSSDEALSADDLCSGCGQSVCSSGSGGCSSCIAHCASAITTVPFDFSSLQSSDMATPYLSGQLPAVYFSFLRPPKLV